MRITKVYTRTGDDGTTGLANGKRVPKDSKRVRLFGSLDELNASIGVALLRILIKILPVSSKMFRMIYLILVVKFLLLIKNWV